jgi:hypothetical protein
MAIETKSSPLKDRPLRRPGQSLDAEILDLVWDGMMSYYFLACMMASLVVIEWGWWFIDRPRNPYVVSLGVLPVLVFSLIRIRQGYKKLKPLKMARQGEIAVGQFLELFREDGARVFHDLVGDKFNVDHVLVCQQGVFVIETKTYSKPKNGRILFDGKKILVDGYNTESKLLIQARAEASWLKRLIKDSTGKYVEVSPVIVFPGWFVETTKEGEKSDITVMNPRMLRGRINKMRKQLSNEDLMLISYHISRFSRAIE